MMPKEFIQDMNKAPISPQPQTTNPKPKIYDLSKLNQKFIDLMGKDTINKYMSRTQIPPISEESTHESTNQIFNTAEANPPQTT